MCQACGQIDGAPIEDPVVGAVRVAPGRVRFVGRDLPAAVRKLADPLPARGPAMLTRRGGAWHLVRFDPNLDEQLARALASREAEESKGPTMLGSVAYIGGPSDAPEQLVALRYAYHSPTLDELLARSSFALDGLLARAGVVPIRKVDPTDPRQFGQLVAALRTSLQTQGRAAASQMIGLVRDEIFARWDQNPEIKTRQLVDGLNRAARKAIGNSWVGIKGAIEQTVEETHAGTKRETVQRYNLAIGASLHATDREAIGRTVATQAHYVRDFEGRLSSGASAQAREIIQRELKLGTGWRELGGMLHRELSAYALDRSRSYYNVVSSAVVARSRSYSQLATFRDAGITRYILSAVLDERTTETCRYLDGKVLSVERGIASYDAVDSLADPTDVKFEQPWLRESTIKTGDDAGKLGIWIPQREGGPRLAAVVDKAAFGTRDAVGSYRGMRSEQLDEALGPPPYHGLCRTTVVPDTEDPRERQVNVPFQIIGGQKPTSADKIPNAKAASVEDQLRTQRAQEEIERYERRLAEEKLPEWRQIEFKERIDAHRKWIEKYKAPPVMSRYGSIVRQITPQVKRLITFMQNGDPRLVGQIQRIEVIDSDSWPKEYGKRFAAIDSGSYEGTGGRILRVKAEAANEKAGSVYERAAKSSDFALKLERDLYQQYKKHLASGVPQKEADEWLRDVRVYDQQQLKYYKAAKVDNQRLFNVKQIKLELGDSGRYLKDEINNMPISDAIALHVDEARAFVDKTFKANLEKNAAKYERAARADYKNLRYKPSTVEGREKWIEERVKSLAVQESLKAYVGETHSARMVVPGTREQAASLTELSGTPKQFGGGLNQFPIYQAPNMKMEKMISAEADNVRHYVARDLSIAADKVKVIQFAELSKGSRGFYDERTKTLAMDNAFGGQRGVRHEYGHHLGEAKSKTTGRSGDDHAHEYLKARVMKVHGSIESAPLVDAQGGSVKYKNKKGEQLKYGHVRRKIAQEGFDLTKDIAFGGDLGFTDRYQARILTSGSWGHEILSRGIELLGSEQHGAWTLYSGDPETASFIFAFLAGKFL